MNVENNIVPLSVENKFAIQLASVLANLCNMDVFEILLQIKEANPDFSDTTSETTLNLSVRSIKVILSVLSEKGANEYQSLFNYFKAKVEAKVSDLGVIPDGTDEGAIYSDDEYVGTALNLTLVGLNNNVSATDLRLFQSGINVLGLYIPST